MLRIAEVGSKSIEIIFYLTSFLNNNKRSVAIFDKTGVPNLVKKYLGAEDDTAVRQIAFDDDSDCDVVFDYYEHAPLDESIEYHEVYYILTQDTADALFLREVTTPAGAEEYFIVKDSFPVKYNSRYLVNLAEKHIVPDNQYALTYNISDVAARGGLAVNLIVKLEKLSEEMKQFLLDQTCKITHLDRKKLAKQLKARKEK